ncbi:MAG: hypothetical protein MJZ98_00275 [Paludibacteraceae bacterium]|nr:hypothetical protein [Paludibacteraceae bacterium]
MTYSKVYIFVLLAVIAASLAACSIEPTIDDYDMYIAIYENDDITKHTIARVYKNKSLIFEGEDDASISYSNFKFENGHVYCIKVTYDETTQKYNREMLKDFQSFSDLNFLYDSRFTPRIIGFSNEHYIYCSQSRNANNGYHPNDYSYNSPEPIIIRQFGKDDSEFCVLNTPQTLLNNHTVSLMYLDPRNKDYYFLGSATMSHSDICSGSPRFFDVYWKNGVEHVMPNNYSDIPEKYMSFSNYHASCQIFKNKVVFGGYAYYWCGQTRTFLHNPTERIQDIVENNGSLYVLATDEVIEEDNAGNRLHYYKNAYIYKDGQLVYENNATYSPKDLHVINGDFYFSAIDISVKFHPFTIWKNNEVIAEYGNVDIKLDSDMLYYYTSVFRLVHK